MFRPRLGRALVPFTSLLDRSAAARNDRPSAWEECTRFPAFPWDLRTLILVFPPDAPFRFLNLNLTLGLTGVPFDQVERWRGSDPKDAFDLQLCLEGRERCATYKQYHSISRELTWRPDDVSFELGGRLRFEGRWPSYRVRYTQPEIDLDLSMELESWPDFHWWARFPGIYYHYTSFCDCHLEWRWKGDEGTIDLPALHDHGWGRNLLPVRLPLRLFRYEVLRLPEAAFAISLWTEGPAGMELKNVGLMRRDRRPIRPMKRYACRVLDWETFKNYAGRPCRVPRRWIGTQQGEAGEFRYEAVRRSEPRTVLGEGFLYAFDYRGQWAGGPGDKMEGEGYVEQLGRFPR